MRRRTWASASSGGPNRFSMVAPMERSSLFPSPVSKQRFHGRRVIDAGDDGTLGVPFHQMAQHNRKVAGRAGGHVIAAIGQKDRRFLRAKRPIDALLQFSGLAAVGELMTCLPHLAREMHRGRLSGGPRSVGGNHDGHSRIRRIRPGAADKDRGRQDSRFLAGHALALQPSGLFHKGSKRLGGCHGLLTLQHHRNRQHIRDRTHFPRERVQQDASGKIGGLGTIGMGSGLEADENVAELGQTSRDVTMQIERAGDRDFRTHEGTNLADEDGLRRTDPFGIHRPVEPQEYGIDRQRGPQRIQNPVHRLPAGLLLDGPAAVGMGLDTGNNGQTGILPDGERAAADLRKTERRRLDWVERVGLVGEPGDEDPPRVARVQRLGTDNKTCCQSLLEKLPAIAHGCLR